jgi:predicted Rossmann fold nucleotide-binding protein DprA/Smf involved in DNA uptake
VKVAIVGSRDYPDIDQVEMYVADRLRPGDVVVSGGARGVDLAAEVAASTCGLDVVVHMPEWDKYGKSAGFRRNRIIVEDADRVVAFWDGKSKGTKHSIDLAHKLGKPVEVFMP